MVDFALRFPEQVIVSALARQLSWSHFVKILPLKQHSNANFMPKCVVSIDGVFAKKDFPLLMLPCQELLIFYA